MKKILFVSFLIFQIHLLFSDIDKYYNDRFSINESDRQKELIIESKLYYSNGLYQKAINTLTKALEIDGKWKPEIYYFLGDVYYDSDSLLSAMKSYELAAISDFKRKDLAYYNAACCASVLNMEFEALSYLRDALSFGYNFWSHIKSDDDLNNIRNNEIFNNLVSNYELPETITNPYQDFKDTKNDSIEILLVDITGNGKKDILVFIQTPDYFGQMGGGNHYFAMYKAEGDTWKFNNITFSNQGTFPGIHIDSFNAIYDSLSKDVDNKEKKPFLVVDLDNDQGNEILVFSGTIAHHHTVKVLTYKDELLKEIGKIDGIEKIVNVNNEFTLIGHTNLDLYYVENFNQIYKEYKIINKSIETNLLSKENASTILNDLKTDFETDPDIQNAVSLFWFQYNYNYSDFNDNWLRNYLLYYDFKFKEKIQLLYNEIK